MENVIVGQSIEDELMGGILDNSNDRSKPGSALKIATMSVISMLLSMQAGHFIKTGPAVQVVFHAAGRMLTPAVITVFVLAFLQVFKHCRIPRNRWLIVLCLNSLMLLAALSETIQMLTGPL